jgi:hypothetical protein
VGAEFAFTDKAIRAFAKLDTRGSRGNLSITSMSCEMMAQDDSSKDSYKQEEKSGVSWKSSAVNECSTPSSVTPNSSSKFHSMYPVFETAMKQ